jgi:hypothetical protein
MLFWGGGEFETFGATPSHSPDPPLIDPLLFAKDPPALVAAPHYCQTMRVAAGSELLGKASIAMLFRGGKFSQ